MKCKNISTKINTFVVQKLKKFKLNGQTSSKMPSMPKEKTTSTITMVDSNKKFSNNCSNNLDNKIQETITTNNEIQSCNSCMTTTTTTTSKDAVNKLNKTITNGSTQHNHQKTQDATTTTGNTHNNHNHHNHMKKRGVNDFRFGKAIGEGSFSTVYVAKDIYTNKEYAIKVCEKAHIIRENKAQYIKTEREAMNILNNVPGFVSLFCTFQDTKNLYFVMSYMKNGDLLPYINKVGSFDLDCTKFYAAELVLALEKMHARGIIHRDLKPENILLDDDMHINIADFGSSKIISNENGQKLNENDEDCGDGRSSPRSRKCSFVGTAQYVSPEVLKGEYTSKASDLWALGCIIYQMISGLPPFRSDVEYQIFQKIQKLELQFPEGFDETAKDLVTKLIVTDPKSRIGVCDCGDKYESIRAHKFFKGIDFDKIEQQTPPQIFPYLPGEDLRSHYRVPDHLEPGLDDKQLQRLLGLELGISNSGEQQDISKKSIADMTEYEKEIHLRIQKENKYNIFCNGEVIIKQGLVNKRKGLFARKRMLLLTTGPRLIYIDPVSMVKKGEIPWSPELRVEPKNFKIFFIHTPNRTYYLEEPEGFALGWCRDIEDVRIYTYGKDTT